MHRIKVRSYWGVRSALSIVAGTLFWPCVAGAASIMNAETGLNSSNTSDTNRNDDVREQFLSGVSVLGTTLPTRFAVRYTSVAAIDTGVFVSDHDLDTTSSYHMTFRADAAAGEKWWFKIKSHRHSHRVAPGPRVAGGRAGGP